MDSVELLLDRTAEQRVLADWQLLHQAGLPSLADHRSPSNAPHVTLVAAPGIGGGTDSLLADAAAGALPVPLVTEGLLIFNGRRGLVLSRHVVCSPQLAEFQHTVHRLLAGAVDALALSQPGNWIPHITLARGLSPGQLAAAVQLLDADRTTGEATRLRRWDSSRKIQQLLPAPH